MRKIKISLPDAEKRWVETLKSAPIGAHILLQNLEGGVEVEVVLLDFEEGRRKYVFRVPPSKQWRFRPSSIWFQDRIEQIFKIHEFYPRGGVR